MFPLLFLTSFNYFERYKDGLAARVRMLKSVVWSNRGGVSWFDSNHKKIKINFYFGQMSIIFYKKNVVFNNSNMMHKVISEKAKAQYS